MLLDALGDAAATVDGAVVAVGDAATDGLAAAAVNDGATDAAGADGDKVAVGVPQAANTAIAKARMNDRTSL